MNNRNKGNQSDWLEIAIGVTVWVLFLVMCAYAVLGFFLTPY